MIDPDVFEMILVNLLSNVEKYVTGGGNCEIKCRRCSDPRDKISTETLIVTVSDDGPGINRRHANRVFRPFERIDDSISAPSGTGIGLTIARRAARRHGGDLVLLGHCKLGGAGFELTLSLDEVAHGSSQSF